MAGESGPDLGHDPPPMDLHPLAARPTEAEVACVATVAGPEAGDLRRTVGLAETESRRHLLLPAFHALQSRFGWISPGGLNEACRRLQVPPAEAYGVATFYALFTTSPAPPTVVHACDDIACRASGAEELCARLQARLGPPGTDRGGTTWMRSPCLGLCEQAPAALLVAAGERPVEGLWGHATADQVEQALATRSPAPRARTVPRQPRESLRLLARVGIADPTDINDYREHGGYEALRRALDMGPAAVIREVTESKLMGRGGAAFPTGRKWAAVASQPVRPHVLICNADESEPGTFKDRVLMEEDPFALVESMTIAGFATGCERGILYVRGEYPLAIERLEGAMAQARARGYLGDDVMGRGLRFDLELRKGAGAYICGEETALFNSIEGFRGEPRNKPPFPVEVGVFGKPTLINNVETLVNVPLILLEGAAAFARIGTEGSTGTRLFCLSGHVAHPGIYEVPFGTTLRALLDLAGGAPGGIQAILLGGAAGMFVTEADLDLPLTFEDTRKAGVTLGSGVVLVFDRSVQMMPMLRRIAEFFRDESCGQCVPCRVGTVRQEELLARMSFGAPLGSPEQEAVMLRELGQCMRDASICGLGQTASSAIESAVARLGLLPRA
jgi:NADH-quinone oxidoreductase subunit F